MATDELALIDEKIAELIKDTNEYGFEALKDKVEEILKSVNIFSIENELNTKAVDMYLKTVITQRNNIKKEEEKVQLKTNKKTKYELIESICKKLEFESQEELIKKISELESKSILELNDVNYSLSI
ncbi:BAR domain-containing protein [Poseidonibacter lekithochrous]|uniref:hypothetical protein n=1 Tax=Poseidonibacter lekithochrous TaxID=1904463 RepID=UPI000D34B4D4|nr:hypothetical protein [Poseidonibacter lekithochrous]